MNITVDSLIRIPANAPLKVLEHMRARLTLANPDYARRTRMGLSTFGIDPEICQFRACPEGWTAPRGADTAAIAKEACQNAGEPCNFIDHRINYASSPLPFSFDLRDYQQAAVDALARRVQGVAQAPCGAGKTVLGAGLIARLGQPSIILVHTHDLVEQWRETIAESMGCKVGIISDGKQQLEDITVATVQSLSRIKDAEVDSIGDRFGLVLVDEAHHTPAATFQSVLGHFPGRHRYGVTATPKREDGLTALIGMAIGPVVFEIGHQELVDAGHLVVPEVVKVETGCSVDSEDYNALIRGLETSTERLTVIAEAALLKNRPTLILANRVDYCEKIASLLQTFGADAEALSGKTPKKRRADILERFKSGNLRILCATSLADEGLDVARLECLILALPTRAHGRTIQRLGRLMRPHAGKARPVLYDMVDDHPIAWGQWAARRRAYRKVLGAGAVG